MNFYKWIAYALLAFVILNTGAHAGPGAANTTLSVYHDQDGNLTEDSEKNAAIMRRNAAKNGYITLLVTANVAFDPYLEGLTEAEIAAQQAAATDKLMEVLQPLVDTGKVWHPTNGPLIQGPGCLIRANVAGLSKLVEDTRILHIVATN